ncbi:hypothetical protein AB0N05_37885 [Nocardia sp. NPDC051030]|uniref:hypothetical protein n=1 Tax=Nocardia sp. NPDC051030 TaxID=3155162 RepID=UPI0034174772
MVCHKLINPNGSLHDPEGSYYDPYAITTPVGEWKYVLDDFGILYGDGWWPLHRPPRTILGEKGTRPVQVRVAPDCAYRAWRNQYVLMIPCRPDMAVVRCRVPLYVRPCISGGILFDRTVTLDLRGQRYELDHRGCPIELYEQLDTKGRRLLDLVLVHRKARRSSVPAPVTAHVLWAAAGGTP